MMGAIVAPIFVGGQTRGGGDMSDSDTTIPIDPRTFAERLMYSTIRLETLRNEVPVGIGTAFFFLYRKVEEKGMAWLPLLVTNKHVIKGSTHVRFRVHLGEVINGKSWPTGKTATVTIPRGPALFMYHPDPDVDLCAMSSGDLKEEAKRRGLFVYSHTLTEAEIPTDAELRQLDMVEDVLMVGYPSGLWDEVNNLPLFRRGITATHPAVDYNGRAETVIDVACFPGSSGSPVLLLGDEPKLLGILYGGPQISAKGEIVVVDIPTAQTPIAMTQVMMHLGYLIKAKDLLFFVETLVAAIDSETEKRRQAGGGYQGFRGTTYPPPG